MKTPGYLHLGLMLTLNSVLLWGAAVPEARYTADILLPCDYALLDSTMGGLGFTRQRVMLVLQNVTVMGEKPNDTLPNYQPPETPETTVFLATVDLAPISFAERLLHVECEGEEVGCEITPLYSQLFAVHIRLPERSIAIMVTATSPINDPYELASEKIVVPMTVDLLVSSYPPTQQGALSAEATFNCEVWSGTEVSVYWHLQKDGVGYSLSHEDFRVTNQQESQEKTKTTSAMTIRRLNVYYGGTYICEVTSGNLRAHQILQMQIRALPQVSLSVSSKPKTTVTCRTDRYYPLDVDVTWLLNGSPLTHVSPITSSHRRNHDGTYSVSSFLEVSVPDPGAPPDTYTCAVSHVSMTDPIMMEVNVLPEQTDLSPTIILTFTFIAIFILFSIFRFLWKSSNGQGKKKAL